MGANQETYDDKFFGAKDYQSTMKEDYHQETRLHTLLDRSDNEDDSEMEDIQFPTKIKVVDDGHGDGDGYGPFTGVDEEYDMMMEDGGDTKEELRRIDDM